MKTLVLFSYPPESDGLSIQGSLLYRGLLETGEDAVPCHFEGGLQKEFYYKQFKPDVVLGVGYWGNAPSLILHPKLFKMKPVPWLLADGWVANYHDVINNLPLVFVTSSWVKEMYKRDGVDTKNFVVAHVGCDTNQFKPIEDVEGIKRVRNMLGVEDDEKMILTAGGDVTSKGAQEMFRALAKIGDEFTNWKYVCKSWPSESANDHHRDELKLIDELGLDREKIIFLDGCFSREFMPYLLNACDVYAAPSRLEGFGMIQVEAMGCGKPVIAIDAMGTKDTIIHEKTGFLAKIGEEIKLESEWVYPWMGFPRKMRIEFDEPKTFAMRADIDHLAEGTLKLLTDNEFRLKLGENAREHAVKNFHYSKLAKFMADTMKERLEIT